MTKEVTQCPRCGSFNTSPSWQTSVKTQFCNECDTEWEVKEEGESAPKGTIQSEVDEV